MSSDRKEALKLLADFSTIGMTVAFSVLIGAWFGWWLDQKVFEGRTEPWFFFIFFGLGVAAAFLNLFRMARRKDL